MSTKSQLIGRGYQIKLKICQNIFYFLCFTTSSPMFGKPLLKFTTPSFPLHSVNIFALSAFGPQVRHKTASLVKCYQAWKLGRILFYVMRRLLALLVFRLLMIEQHNTFSFWNRLQNKSQYFSKYLVFSLFYVTKYVFLS